MWECVSNTHVTAEQKNKQKYGYSGFAPIALPLHNKNYRYKIGAWTELAWDRPTQYTVHLEWN
jgi:hypothetical protein